MKSRTHALFSLMMLLGLFCLCQSGWGQEAAAAAAPAVESESVMDNLDPFLNFKGTCFSLLPPVLAIVLALVTKRVYMSLTIGVVCGGLLLNKFEPMAMMNTVVFDGFKEAIVGGAGIFIFLIVLGIVVALVSRTGATAAFGNWAKKHVKTRIGAQLATFVLGVLIFIDDYFNCLTVGSVMLPVTDSKRISRAKLAFLIDATAAPICMIAPVSSWAAAVAKYTEGTGMNGIELFIKAIPYNFYSLLTLIFILGIVFFNADFGPMARHERNAIEKGDLFTEGGEVDNGLSVAENAKGRVMDLLIPVLFLIVFCVFALLRCGGYFEGDNSGNIINSFSDTDATAALPVGGLVTLLLACLYLLDRDVIKAKDIVQCIFDGFAAMLPAILILTLAMSLKNMTTALDSDQFVKSVMANTGSLKNFLPCIIFLVACFIAFSTGTSWGTFGILIPIVSTVFVDHTSSLFIIGMSACLAGAVCGDHCSPISDTTIMSSAGARCEHINHVNTQLPYSISVAGISFVCFVLAGLVQNWFIVFPIGVVLTLGFLLVMKHFAAKKCQSDKN